MKIFTGKNKYGAKKTEADGIMFDSKKEAIRYLELKRMEVAGIINDLQLQPRFDIVVNDIFCGFYKADFAYYDDRDDWIVEDVKGMRTPVFNLKKKIVEALYGVEIKIT